MNPLTNTKQFTLSDWDIVQTGSQLVLAERRQQHILPTSESRLAPILYPHSRRQFLRTAGIGTAVVLGVGAFPGRAKANPVVVGIMIKFLVAVFASVVAGLILDRVRSASWYKRSLEADDEDTRFHLKYASPYETDTVIPTFASKDYNKCHFALKHDGRLGRDRDLNGLQDLNAPEYKRLIAELRKDGPYRPVADKRAARRRSLSKRDLDLFDATLKLYKRDSDVPARSQIVACYAREICDAAGHPYTGFGVELRSGAKNFLVASSSSA